MKFTHLATALSIALLSTAASADEVLIGDLHPITGPATYYGLPESNGIKLAAEQINAAGGISIGGKSYQIKVVTEDTQGNPTTGVAALRKLVNQNVHYVIGPLSSGVAPALKPIIERNADMTQIIDGAITENLTNGRNVFRNQATVNGYNVSVVALFKDKKFPSVAFMTDRFHAGFMGSQKQLISDLEALGTKITDEKYYKLNDTDFSATLTSLKSTNPAVILVRGYPAEAALIVKQIRQLGLSSQIVWEMVSPPSTVLKNIPSDQMNGVLNCVPPTTEDYVHLKDEKALALDKAYRAKFNTAPGELTALSFDAVHILKAAFEKAGSLENAAVNKALSGLKVADVSAAITRYTPYADGKLFDSQGQVDLRGACGVWKNDTWNPLQTASQ